MTLLYLLFYNEAMKKILFFDIDGTITSEIDGTIPSSTIHAIREARKNGHLMYINTGRCFQNVENRFREIGFDGYICGCGTNIYANGKELFYQKQTHEMTMQILENAAKSGLDILLESKYEVCFDTSRPFTNPQAKELYLTFRDKHKYEMRTDLYAEDFFCDKFVIWFEDETQLESFRKFADSYFECIDRGGQFREFVPWGYSKATGIQFILDFYKIPLSNAYAIGDSNNDMPMLKAVPNSIAMGNAYPETLFNEVSYVTRKASENGIYHALKHFEFI